jgi:hypothetical protein
VGDDEQAEMRRRGRADEDDEEDEDEEGEDLFGQNLQEYVPIYSKHIANTLYQRLRIERCLGSIF